VFYLLKRFEEQYGKEKILISFDYYETSRPEARKVLRKDQRFVSQSYTRVYPLVWQKGERHVGGG